MPARQKEWIRTAPRRTVNRAHRGQSATLVSPEHKNRAQAGIGYTGGSRAGLVPSEGALRTRNAKAGGAQPVRSIKIHSAHSRLRGTRRGGGREREQAVHTASGKRVHGARSPPERPSVFVYGARPPVPLIEARALRARVSSALKNCAVPARSAVHVSLLSTWLGGDVQRNMATVSTQ